MMRVGDVIVQLSIVGALVVLWWILTAGGFVSPFLLPSPGRVAAAFGELVRRPDTWSNLGWTVSAVLASAAIAVPSARRRFATAASDYWKAVLRPILYFPLSIPKSVFLPLFILTLGIGPSQSIAFGTFSIVFLMVVTAIAAVESVPEEYLRVARSLDASLAQTVRHVYLPSMVPVLLEGLRLSMIFGFTGILVAEMYASRGGFGRSLSSWGENFQVDQLLAGVLLVSLVAIGINEAVRAAERRAERWRA